MRYRIVYEKAPRNWCAYSPDLWGCVAAATTLDECRREMHEAIAFHLEGLAMDGDVRPRPTGYDEVIDEDSHLGGYDDWQIEVKPRKTARTRKGARAVVSKGR